MNVAPKFFLFLANRANANEANAGAAATWVDAATFHLFGLSSGALEQLCSLIWKRSPSFLSVVVSAVTLLASPDSTLR